MLIKNLNLKIPYVFVFSTKYWQIHKSYTLVV